MTSEPTGEQITLRLDDDTAVVTAQVTEVGASLRALAVNGIDLIARYPLGEAPPAGSGLVLLPWPNRVRDGRWQDLDGVEHQLPLTEPARHNAIHGLLTETAYDISRLGPDRVLLGATVRPQSGYPCSLDTVVDYALTPTGISVTHEVANTGRVEAPLAIGAHPYLCLGDTPATELVLTSPGAQVIETDDRLLPVATVPVGRERDLRGGRVLADLSLDTGYADLDRDTDGRARHRLTDTAGRSVSLWQDEQFGFVQLYTTTAYPGRPFALAVEPMTGPADAYNSGVGLTWLAPGETFTATWGIDAEFA